MYGLSAVQCDPFWSQMNGAKCSDEFGNFLRPDGSTIPMDALITHDDKRSVMPFRISTPVLIGAGAFLLLLMVVKR